jgi:hypothetical protein
MVPNLSHQAPFGKLFLTDTPWECYSMNVSQQNID